MTAIHQPDTPPDLRLVVADEPVAVTPSPVTADVVVVDDDAQLVAQVLVAGGDTDGPFDVTPLAGWSFVLTLVGIVVVTVAAIAVDAVAVLYFAAVGAITTCGVALMSCEAVAAAVRRRVR